jgi:Flp pilus assembly protein TadD
MSFIRKKRRTKNEPLGPGTRSAPSFHYYHCGIPHGVEYIEQRDTVGSCFPLASHCAVSIVHSLVDGSSVGTLYAFFHTVREIAAITYPRFGRHTDVLSTRTSDIDLRLGLPALVKRAITVIVAIGITVLSLPYVWRQSRIFAARFVYDRALQEFGHANRKGYLRYLEYASTLDPSHPQVWNRLCEEYALSGEYGPASQSCERQVTLAPSASSFRLLGRVLQESNDLAGAETAYRNALKFDPTLGAPYYSLGSIFAESGRMNESVTILQKGMENTRHNDGQICQLLTDMLFILRRYNEALTPLQCAVMSNPKEENDISLRQLGFVYELSGKDSEAQATYRKAMPDLPKNYRYSCLGPKREFNFKSCIATVKK